MPFVGTTYSLTGVQPGSHKFQAAIVDGSGTVLAETSPFAWQVGQTTPTINWSNPADITYGTALSSTQLDAIASVDGSFTYTPAAGTILGAGQDQTLSVNFTPTDTTDFSTVTASVTINVDQATPVVSVAPVLLTYGTALADAQLGGTAAWMVDGAQVSVPGTYTYTSASGTVLNASSSDYTESVTFRPDDTTDYTSVTTTVAVHVAEAALTITTSGTQAYGGSPSFSVHYSGFVQGQGASALSGTLVDTTSTTSNSNAGTYTAAVSATGLTSTNYAITYVAGSMVVTAALTITASGGAGLRRISKLQCGLQWFRLGSGRERVERKLGVFHHYDFQQQRRHVRDYGLSKRSDLDELCDHLRRWPDGRDCSTAEDHR